MTSRTQLTTMTARSTLCIVVVALSALGLGLLWRPSPVTATPPTSAPPTSPQVAPPVSAPVPVVDAGVAQPAPVADTTRATVVFATTPLATAMVTWGRKRLGKITPGKPLVVVRPRDSGPLDVMVRAEGYFPVQTRGHTFSDNRVMVKLTPLANKSELLGYRAPIDAGVATPEQAAALNALGGPDGGVPQDGTTFRVVPVAPVPSPLLMP